MITISDYFETQNKLNQQEKWDLRFLSMAKHPMSWSKDPSTKVGALLVSPNRRTIIPGYNGFPSRLSDDPKLYACRETKYKRVLHAEENAVINAKQDLEGFTLYSPVPPCNHCALIVIQAGITLCVSERPTEDMLSRWAESFTTSLALFAEAGVEYREY